MIKPKGCKVLVEQIDKSNQEDKTKFGIILSSKEKDSGDDALLQGKVIEVGTDQVIDGVLHKVDVKLKTNIFFNRYNAFKVYSKGLSTFWVVDCKDVWCAGEIE